MRRGLVEVDAAVDGFEELTVVLLLLDLASFTPAVSGLSAVEIAVVLDRFHRLATRQVVQHGGRVVKLSGDNCLAMFDPVDAPSAVRCAISIREDVGGLGQLLGMPLELGANLHLATVAAGMFGDASNASFDVAGLGVIHVYRLGSGAGIRLSEPVYRKLPSGDRSAWRRQQAPTTYRFEP